MSSSVLRQWATPVTVATTVVTAVTGVLIFFHANVGLVRPAHEWIGMAMVAAVGAHLWLNWRPFLGYLRRPLPAGIMAAGVLLTGLSFLGGGEAAGGPRAIGPVMQALGEAPVPLLAELAAASEAEIVARLEAAGYAVPSPAATLDSIAGEDMEARLAALGAAFGS